MAFDSQDQHQKESSAEPRGPLPKKLRIIPYGSNSEDGVVSADLSSGKAPSPPNRSRQAGAGKSYLMKDGKPTCSLCNKSFNSPKSLFGHMRCHPERHWRGMQPPPTPTPSPNCSEIADVADGGPTLDLPPGWSIKDKRGRKLNLECDAALGLLMLADSDPEIDEIAKTQTTVDKKIKSYNCAICGKSFASPQALGGHMSGAHNNKNSSSSSSCRMVKDGVLVSKSAVGKQECGEEIVENKSSSSSPQPHVCRTCEKAFPSGQALGGHQRCHWQGPSSSSSSTSPAGKQQMNVNVGFDFDLNELPDNNDDDDDGGASGMEQ